MKKNSPVVTIPDEQISGGSPVTFLFSTGGPTTKRFFLDDEGEVQTESHLGAFKFTHQTVFVNDLRSLVDCILDFVSTPNVMLVRGNPIAPITDVMVRRKTTLAERSEGTNWVMLDIDGVDAPEGMDPNTPKAIHWLIVEKLPECFQDVTCFVQFSSSAGILNSDGKLLKTGIRAHLFFWFAKPIPGPTLTAWLKLFCLESKFFDIKINSGGSVDMKYGIDMAPIRSAVQPHYIAYPILESGVQCQLSHADRFGEIVGKSDVVKLPDIDDGIFRQAKSLHEEILNGWKEQHGFKRQTRQIVTKQGFATQTYYASGSVKTGRPLDRVEMRGEDDRIARLFFSDESTPGSWYVVKDQPQLAWRYGGGESETLKELSEEAYQYVRDELKWFNDIPYHAMALMTEGYVPSFNSFALARHAVILAPTGSGKTRAAIEWMAEASKSQLLIYVAQTIALVNQMGDDLRKAAVQWSSYTSFGPATPLNKGVYVTTNESLHKMMGVLGTTPYYLILDEIHMGLDDFAKTQGKFDLLQKAITKASRVFYMTGTLTEIQRQMIVELVAGTLQNDGMNEQAFCTYEFAPVKQNPLKLRRLDNYKADVITLLENYSARIKRNEIIPRTVFILPTSKLEEYRILADSYGLSDHTKVVSGQENTKIQINDARIGSDAILIASPLFSVGLNFETAPSLFCCRFDLVDVDKSSIVQTINRANRSSVPCEVRIYCGAVDMDPFYFPVDEEMIEEIKTVLIDELPEISFDFSLPMFLDRLAYRGYRDIERNSNKALGNLIRDNQFQNYVIVDERELVTDDKKKKNELYKQAKDGAKDHYEAIVLQHSPTQGGLGMCFSKLDTLAAERRDWVGVEKRVDRDIEAEELQVVMTICDLGDVSSARKVSIPKIRVLLGNVPPWLSEMRGNNYSQEWAKSAAMKVKALLVVIGVLRQLQAKDIDGHDVGRKLNQDKLFQSGLKALCNNQAELTSLSRDLKILEALRKLERQNRDEAKKKKAERKSLEMTEDLLEKIGIFFPHEKKGKYVNVLYDQPIVPSWDFDEIKLQLQRLEHLLKKLPQDKKYVSKMEMPEGYFATTVNTCRECTFYNHQLALCSLEIPVDFSVWGIEGGNYPADGVQKNCVDFSKTLAKLAPPPA